VVNRVVLTIRFIGMSALPRMRPTRENAEVNTVSVIPREFPRLPGSLSDLLHQKHGNRSIRAFRADGFQPQENLFFVDGRWDAAYVPLQIQRQPFSLITRRAEDSGEKPPSLDVALDMSQTVQSHEGQRLFLEDGQPTKFLQDITSMLSALVAGAKETYAFTGRLAELSLIEPVQIDIEFVNGSETKLQGLYWIAAATLKALPAAQLANYAIASFSNGCTFRCISRARVGSGRPQNRLLSGATAARP